ncbi:unnamed protein product [Blepharisma stoltei]|uniref:Secreted protein n=1 Tax=Blepharisma stoltei TaxID=1481888 RepID=A0AAU9IEQ5_9CILI|nr:unnamed protein product [Blepharisma stoltei]
MIDGLIMLAFLPISLLLAISAVQNCSSTIAITYKKFLSVVKPRYFPSGLKALEFKSSPIMNFKSRCFRCHLTRLSSLGSLAILHDLHHHKNL